MYIACRNIGHKADFGGRKAYMLNLLRCGFGKSGRDNLRRDELATHQLLADEYLSLDAAGLVAARATGAVIEVKRDDEAI